MLKSLNVAQSGLSAAKIAVENVSNNIANENTPGYKKRVVQLSELELIDGRMTGRGVRADQTYRIISQYMYDNILKENSKTNYYNEVSSIVGNIEKMFQETKTSGFSSDFNRFFQAAENLRSNPNSEIYRTTFKTQGRVLVDSLRNLYSNIEKQENLTKLSLKDNVQKVNDIINQIGSINQQLGQHVVASNDLLDKRDELEKELSKYVDIDVDRSNNEYTLKVGGAIAVRFNTNIREVNLVEEFTPQIDRFSTNPPTGAPKDAIAEKFGTPQAGDKITYKFNNEFSVTIEIGSNKYTDNQGNSYDLDLDGDGNPDTVDATNYIRAMTKAINSNVNISQKVIAYNGNYELDADGNKVDNLKSDDFLLVESRNEGENAKFQGRITFEKYEKPNYGVSGITPNDLVDKDPSVSVTKQEHIIVNGTTFNTTGEDFSALAVAMNNNPSFNPTTFDSVKKELSIKGFPLPFSTEGKSYADLANAINNVNKAHVGSAITINGTDFVTAGTDFSTLAKTIDTQAGFTSSFNAFTNELTINGQKFSTSGITSYSSLATNINADPSFTSSVPTSTSIVIKGEAFTTATEDFAALATAMNGSAKFTPVTYNGPPTNTLSINGYSTPFSTAGKSYSDLVNDINTATNDIAAKGTPITIAGNTYVTAGEDFTALANAINASPPSVGFTANYNAATNTFELNDGVNPTESFSTAALTTYKTLASKINSSDNFSSYTEVRGNIQITVGGTTKTFNVNDTTTYEDLANTINNDPDLSAHITADGKLVIHDANNLDNPLTITENLPTPINIKQHEKETGTLFRNDHQSKMAEDKVHLSVFDSEVKINSGIIKAQVDNLTTSSPNNKIIDYKNKLDNFARALSDIYDKYVKTGNDQYKYGHVATDEYNGTESVKNLNLFSGSDVKSLKFNEDAVNDLKQSDLDYMATLQWKKDVEFDGFAQDGSSKDATSFSEFFQDIKVNISSDKENNDFLLKTQETVGQSLQHSFDKLTKVDKDEEMVNLIKFQAAYTANAKIITVVDQMLDTILGIR